ncbi:MAG TPA: hypothetical protein PK379_13170, partial [Candidatus Hydrogenedentes bacterium]|nr:hypothetical protein [Candidatus Hydrogenedentota bacterium]
CFGGKDRALGERTVLWGKDSVWGKGYRHGEETLRLKAQDSRARTPCIPRKEPEPQRSIETCSESAEQNRVILILPATIVPFKAFRETPQSSLLSARDHPPIRNFHAISSKHDTF